MKKEPRVVIAGSRKVPPGHAGRLLIRFLANLPDDATVLLRRGVSTAPGHFEEQVAELCAIVGTKVEWAAPETPAREGVFQRDIDLVAGADLVLAFLTLEQVGDEHSGTFGLVDKATYERTPVYAFAFDGEQLVRIGEDDPGNLWGAIVPTA